VPLLVAAMLAFAQPARHAAAHPLGNFTVNRYARIEIYRDRPRSEWPRLNGQIRMATDPLDRDGVMSELEGYDEAWTGLHPQTVLGHMHLHVGNLPQASAFYGDVIGLDLITRFGNSALFMPAGGYHHHLGLNTWARRRSRRMRSGCATSRSNCRSRTKSARPPIEYGRTADRSKPWKRACCCAIHLGTGCC